MTDTPYDAAMTRSKQELARQVVECNDRIAALKNALRSIANKCPVTCDMTLAHEMAEEAEAALVPESK